MVTSKIRSNSPNLINSLQVWVKVHSLVHGNEAESDTRAYTQTNKEYLCLPLERSRDILFFPLRPSICLSVCPPQNRVGSIT